MGRRVIEVRREAVLGSRRRDSARIVSFGNEQEQQSSRREYLQHFLFPLSCQVHSAASSTLRGGMCAKEFSQTLALMSQKTRARTCLATILWDPPLVPVPTLFCGPL